MKLKFSRRIFEKYSNRKFRGNPSSGSRIFPCGKTVGQPDMTELMVAFRNFANGHKTVWNTVHKLPSKARRSPADSGCVGVEAYRNSKVNSSDPARLPYNDSGEPFPRDFVGNEAVPLKYIKPHRRRVLTGKRPAVNYQAFSRPEEWGVPLGCILKKKIICIRDGSVPPQKNECLIQGHLVTRQQSSKAFNLRNCLC